MTTSEKRYLSSLELRVYKLEMMMEGMRNGMVSAEYATPACNQCNMIPYDGMVCSVSDCIQGRNPSDDEEQSEQRLTR